MSIIFEDLGIPLQHQKIVPGNTITSISANCYVYRTWQLDYDSGGTTEVVAGDWIVGATSGAVGKVVNVTLSSGTWAGGDAAGFLIIDSKVGTFQDNENIKVGSDANVATVNEPVTGDATPVPYPYEFKEMQAKAALVCVYANTALVRIDGGKPDQTALAGIPMAANSSIVLRNIAAIRNFKCVDYVAASASTIQITFFF